MHEHQELVDLLKWRALRKGEFTLASGRKSNYYVDARNVTLSARGAALIGLNIFALLADKYKDVKAIGGLTMGADPIVGAVLCAAGTYGGSHLAGFLVRKEAKDHGAGGLIAGPLEPGMSVGIVEDVTTTGESAMKAVNAAVEFGCTVACVITVLDRLEGAEARFKQLDLPFHALTTIRDLGVEPPEQHHDAS